MSAKTDLPPTAAQAETSPLIGQHLVFIHHEQVRVPAFKEAVTLRLEGRDNDRGAQVIADIARGDAHIPALGQPFGPFVVGQGPGGYRVDGLAAMPALDEQFEDVGLAGASRGLDDDILTLAEGAQGGLLPEVG